MTHFVLDHQGPLFQKFSVASTWNGYKYRQFSIKVKSIHSIDEELWERIVKTLNMLLAVVPDSEFPYVDHVSGALLALLEQHKSDTEWDQDSVSELFKQL